MYGQRGGECDREAAKLQQDILNREGFDKLLFIRVYHSRFWSKAIGLGERDKDELPVNRPTIYNGSVAFFGARMC